MSEPSTSTHLSRNEFVKIVFGTLSTLMGAVIGLPGVIYLVSPALRKHANEEWIPLGRLQDYPIGIPTLFNFTRSQINGWEKAVFSYGVFVIRKNERQVLALSNICTHLGCRVSWHADLQHYVSPCHNGHFDMLGNVLSGPPPRPLDEFFTKIEDGNLYIRYPSFKRS